MSDQAAQDLLIKRELIDDILHSEDGVVKKASAATSKATRTQIREEGFQRAILSFDMITNDDLDYFGDSELPGVWFELEPDSPPARIIPYNDTPNSFAYRAEKYVVLIAVVSTEEATKNVNHLRTYKTDIRQIVNDNMLRDIHTAEDTAFLAEVDRIVGNAVNLSTNPDAEVQHINMGAGITRLALKRAVSFLTDRQIPMGVSLCNQRTANELLAWQRNEVGGDLAEELLRKGLKALDRFEIFGHPYISTIKNGLVGNGVVYQFAPKEFMGNALMLEDVTVTIKKEYDIIRMRAQEQIGLTIGNTRSVQKLNFVVDNTVTT
jgi:hypothetical protein